MLDGAKLEDQSNASEPRTQRLARLRSPPLADRRRRQE